ncbi:MAG: DUF4143 domain-containing protein, partial [Bacteroidota bacterium]
YVSLENPDIQSQALEDPRSFLELYNDKVIFDEAQRVPELFSYLQEEVDKDRRAGRFILSGSQNFLLRKNITQSLAGRVGIAFLLPLDLNELSAFDLRAKSYEEAIFKGFYPAIFSENVPSDLFYPSYEYSYIERDVSGLINSSNLAIFRQFIRVCATYAGQLVNYAAIAKACGISTNTVRSWLSILEQSFIIFRLMPYFKNFGKRLVKSPKLYFYDTGLLCYLLRITESKEVVDHPQKGALFENLVIAEQFKRTYHLGKQIEFYFFRDNNALEVDLLKLGVNKMYLTEIKATRTFKSKLSSNLHKVAAISDMDINKSIVYGGEESFRSKDVEVKNWYS